MNEAGGCEEDHLSPGERKVLLQLARGALYSAVQVGTLPALNMTGISPRLCLAGASFVTLTRCGGLRGCVGALEAQRPLALDVYEHAAAAALYDHRFPPVRPPELPEIKIEISRLTPACRLEYQCPEELLTRLRPGLDGVLLRSGYQQATFLPQVWEKIPEPELFLSLLCEKMHASRELWRSKELQVFTYQVEKFCEGEAN